MNAVDSKVITLIRGALQDDVVNDARASRLAAEVGRLYAAVLRANGVGS